MRDVYSEMCVMKKRMCLLQQHNDKGKKKYICTQNKICFLYNRIIFVSVSRAKEIILLSSMTRMLVPIY